MQRSRGSLARYLEDVLQLPQHSMHFGVQQPAELLLLRTALRSQPARRPPVTHPSPARLLTRTARSAAVAAIAVAIVAAAAQRCRGRLPDDGTPRQCLPLAPIGGASAGPTLRPSPSRQLAGSSRDQRDSQIEAAYIDTAGTCPGSGRAGIPQTAASATPQALER